MSETHINAYEMEVSERLVDKERADAEYQAALDRLDAKRQELGLNRSGTSVDKKPDEPEQPVQPKEPAQVPKKK